jgi:hypothetical protein
MTRSPHVLARGAAALLLTAVLATGCGLAGSGEPDTGAAPESSSFDVAANTRESCAAAVTVMAEGMNKYSAAIAKGLSSSAADALTAMAAGLRAQAAKTVDPELKGMLERLAAGAEKAAKVPGTHYDGGGTSVDGAALAKRCQG